MEIFARIESTQFILDDGMMLLAESAAANTIEEEAQLLDEARALMGLAETCVRPVIKYYIGQEMQLCDILHEYPPHNYGENRKRSIASLTEYEALTFLNFRKQELRQIFWYFQLPERVEVYHHEQHRYLFGGEEVFIFLKDEDDNL